MAELAIGISLCLPTATRSDPDAVGPVIDAFTAPSWPRPLRYYFGAGEAPKALPRPPGRLRNARLREELTELLQSDALHEVSLSTTRTRRRNEEWFARFDVCTRFALWCEYAHANGYLWLNHDVRPTIVVWIDDMLAFAAKTRAFHGVIAVMNRYGAVADVSFCGYSREGRDEHPFPAEFRRMQRAEREIGIRYVRFPRWGTIYSRAQVAQLGGVTRIQDLVRPAVVRDVGADAIYFQLTDSVSTALSDEAMAKQRTFTAIAEPLLPPVVDESR